MDRCGSWDIDRSGSGDVLASKDRHQKGTLAHSESCGCEVAIPADNREATFELRKDQRIEIRSNDISLLRLGQPLLGTFSLNVILHPRECKSCGVFFGSQRAGQQLTFQTLEFDHYTSCLLYTSPNPRDRG